MKKILSLCTIAAIIVCSISAQLIRTSFNKQVNPWNEDDEDRHYANTSGQVNWITDDDEEKAEKRDYP